MSEHIANIGRKAVTAAGSSVIGAAASHSAPVEAARAVSDPNAVELFIRWAPVTASFLGALYTLHLLCEWWWKRWWRPFLIGRGWWSDKSAFFRGESGMMPLDETKK